MEREAYAEEAGRAVTARLAASGINALVLGRPKHLYSTFGKLKRYEALGRDFDEIYDLIALRIITDTVADCYSALASCTPLASGSGAIRRLHRLAQGEPVPVSPHLGHGAGGPARWRSRYARRRCTAWRKNGVAAHWVYKEGEEEPARLDDKFEQKLSWLKQLIEWQREVQGDQEYLDTVKTDILRDQVFVYTPAGEVKELPAGATPLDFAFRIHTELGLNCVGAYVNGKSVPLNTKLSNGDTVRVRKSFTDRGPSLDWLNSDLGYLTTASGRARVRAWFRRQAKSGKY